MHDVICEFPLSYIQPEIKPTVSVCRFAHPLFSQLMAEYVLAEVISWERKFKLLHKWQENKFWPETLEANMMPRSLNDLNVGILGYGNMAQAVAKAFQV